MERLKKIIEEISEEKKLNKIDIENMLIAHLNQVYPSEKEIIKEAQELYSEVQYNVLSQIYSKKGHCMNVPSRPTWTEVFGLDMLEALIVGKVLNDLEAEALLTHAIDIKDSLMMLQLTLKGVIFYRNLKKEN